MRLSYGHVASNFSDGQVHIEIESRRVTVLLETVLQVISGSSAIPPLGFDETPTIKFSHDPVFLFPAANTCTVTITLPTAIEKAEVFASNITFGIYNSSGFGDV